MKLIILIFNNVKNVLPYFMLIFIYFFLINLEAKNDKVINITTENEYYSTDEKSVFPDINQRVKIPVIPYKE